MTEITLVTSGQGEGANLTPISDGLGSWSWGSPSISGTGATGTDAEAPTYGRASTIAAPTLRDFVSLNDFCAAGGGNGNGSTNDSTVTSTALSALANAGGGTLYIPVLNPAGTQATWTISRVSVTPSTNVRVIAYGAQFQASSASSGGSLFKGDGNSSTAGSYLVTRFRLEGGVFLGKNTELINQSIIQVDRGQDITVQDTYATNWGGPCVYCLDSTRVRVLNNTFLNCSQNSNQNPINIGLTNSANGDTTLLQDVIVTGNVVTTSAGACAVSFGSNANNPVLMLTQVGNPTGGTTTVQMTVAGYSIVSTSFAPGATAATIQTAIQSGITSAGGPANSVSCYGGPLGQQWNGSTAPNPPVLIVFTGATMVGQATGLGATDTLTGGTAPKTRLLNPPMRVLVANNSFESSGWTAFTLELGGANPGATIQDVVIVNNILNYDGNDNGAAYGMAILNDGSPLIGSPTLFQHILVVNNKILSNRNGIQCMGSSVILNNNEVTAENVGIQCNPPTGGSANPLTQVHIKGGILHMLDTADAGGGVVWTGVNNSTIDGLACYWDTGTTNNSEGLQLNQCFNCQIRVSVTHAPNRGIRLNGCGQIRIQSGTTLYDPSSATSTSTSAVRIEGTLTGNIFIDGLHVYDDQSKHTYSVDTSPATLAGFGVWERHGTLIGWTTSALNGTFTLGGLNDIWDTTGVVYTAGKRITWGTAAPTTGTWAVGDTVWNTNPTTSSSPAFWTCYVAGTPGSWQSVNLGSGGGGGAAQNGLVRKTAAYTMLLTDSGVSQAAGSTVVTKAPAGVTSTTAMLTWVLKNTSTVNQTLDGNGGKFDNFTGGSAATQLTVSSGAAQVFMPDPNNLGTDWLLV